MTRLVAHRSAELTEIDRNQLTNDPMSFDIEVFLLLSAIAARNVRNIRSRTVFQPKVRAEIRATNRENSL